MKMAEFYRKYKQFSKLGRNKTEPKRKGEEGAERENALGLPSPYDQRYRY